MTPAEFAALAVAWLLQASRLLQSTKAAWGIIPPKYQWVPPFALTFVTELSVKLATGVHTWTDLAVPVLIVLSPLLPGARSNVHAALDGLATKLAENPTVTELGPVGLRRLTRGAATPSAAVLGTAFPLLLCALCLAFVPACSPAPKDPTAIAAGVRKDAQLSYAIGVISLTALDDIYAAWLNAIPQPTDEQLAAGAKIVGALKGVRDGLALARPWVEDGTGNESAARAAVTQSLDAAATAGEIMGQIGAKVPDVVFDALNAARTALGSRS